MVSPSTRAGRPGRWPSPAGPAGCCRAGDYSILACARLQDVDQARRPAAAVRPADAPPGPAGNPSPPRLETTPKASRSLPRMTYGLASREAAGALTMPLLWATHLWGPCGSSPSRPSRAPRNLTLEPRTPRASRGIRRVGAGGSWLAAIHPAAADRTLPPDRRSRWTLVVAVPRRVLWLSHTQHAGDRSERRSRPQPAAALAADRPARRWPLRAGPGKRDPQSVAGAVLPEAHRRVRDVALVPSSAPRFPGRTVAHFGRPQQEHVRRRR